MFVIIKTEKEKKILYEAGRRLALVLDEVEALVRPGATSAELNSHAERRIKEMGDVPSFLHYTPAGSRRPYPAGLCVSINDEVVHGIPSEERLLKEGDIVGLDIGLRHEGLFVDMARTLPVGNVSKEARDLIFITKESLEAGILAAKSGGYVGDIGAAIEVVAKRGKLGIVRELGGHGVGEAVHEEPYIANFGKTGTGEKLIDGMVLALEPMLTLGSPAVVLGKDGYTFRTRDGSLSAHFEHTIIVTPDGGEIVTC
ncbi:MAG: type I methionyl aminopeptidase [Candidatus Lloydbacteria bacterium]|nr:type I methionyl aminopeptidase [Candidatus Lloydbacteria bacterium]